MWKNEFCDPDLGFAYAFTKMHAIYGGYFEQHWRNIDPKIIRQTWLEICGRGLTYRPKIDYAIHNMSPDHPPSALAFSRLLRDGPPIPTKTKVEVKTPEQIQADAKMAAEAKAKVQEVLRKLKAPK